MLVLRNQCGLPVIIGSAQILNMLKVLTLMRAKISACSLDSADLASASVRYFCSDISRDASNFSISALVRNAPVFLQRGYRCTQ